MLNVVLKYPQFEETVRSVRDLRFNVLVDGGGGARGKLECLLVIASLRSVFRDIHFCPKRRIRQIAFGHKTPYFSEYEAYPEYFV